ncbi:hypothetical protein Bca4012_058205 [Brassica carinata]
MSPPPSATADIRHEIDPKIWRACAGASVQIPALFSRVYYFPQGHAEHCCPSSSVISSAVASPIPCVVSSISLLADPITDEVFAHLSLHPVAQDQFQFQFPFPPSSRFGEERDDEKVVTFAKVLTASDANNGGGFSVPRYCADSVFPPLDFQVDPPVQKLFITDVHGVVWDFRHIYRGTPRRHLLTTGWSKFVNNKKLICGDSVVFMRKSVHEMFIGVRRAPSSNKGGGGGSYYGDEYYAGCYGGGGIKKEDGGEKKGFSRVGMGKLTAEAVSEAIGKASQGLPFEVVYYPTAGWSDFVVRAEDVEASVSVYWAPGTRVKMAMETEDSSRITWFQGVVSASFQETWKQLQITWDEPEILQNLKRVNPWQVEVVASSTQLHATYTPPTKRSKYPHGSSSGFLSGGEEGEMIYPGRGQAMDPNHYGYTTYTTVPAGMQGARHYEFGSYNNSTGFIGENAHPEFNFFSPLPGLGRVSTTQMMNFASPPSDDLSPNSNTTNVSSGNDAAGNNRGISFQLFGKVINVQEPAESGVAESSLCEEDGSKESSDNEVPNEAQLQGHHGGRCGV